MKQLKRFNIDKLKFLNCFEVKDVLIKLANGDANTSESNIHQVILDAGRGNPNFLAILPRYAFYHLTMFAIQESIRSFVCSTAGIGGFPKREGIEERFESFISENNNSDDYTILRDAVHYVRDELQFDVSKFLYEMCEGILGIHYPVPGRMLPFSEKIVNHYVRKEISSTHSIVDKFDLFAVEGGTAAITCIFHSFHANHLLKVGDKIALGMPIFAPYLEIPHLKDYQLEVVPIYANKDEKWQYPKSELDKLRDPQVKALFLINPSNPLSVKLDDASLDHIASIVKERPDLIIVTDDVYSIFAEQFVSLFTVCPRNTILVYSYSKYYGATGWRIGFIGVHCDNIFDEQIAKLDNERCNGLSERYKSIAIEPHSLKFIDRLVADSRTIALNHTAGLSTPQQIQMVLFSLFSLLETSTSYKIELKKLLQNRKHGLYRGLDIHLPDSEKNDNAIDYYIILDLELLGKHLHGEQFAKWFHENMNTREFLCQLADEAHVVLLPADSFGIDHSSLRVSLANLNEPDYTCIGKAIRNLIEKYFQQFTAKTSNKQLSKL